MHKGEYVGCNAKGILILGESHHISKVAGSPNKIAGKEATYDTADVVREYFADPGIKNRNLRFFKKLADSFGTYTSICEERTHLWDNIYFANYVDVLCGVGDDTAKKLIKANSSHYNHDLFEFINKHGIEVVFCFGISVYDHGLPGLRKDIQEEIVNCWKRECGIIGGKRNYIRRCVYLPGIEHPGADVRLNKQLEVYGLRHPSAQGGYDATQYRNVLSDILSYYIG